MSQTAIDREMLSQAQAVALLTDDPKSKLDPNAAVGAIIARGNVVISRSANVLPETVRELAQKIHSKSTERYHYIEHAERAAIITALMKKQSLTGATMYCTRFPCSDCARAIVMTGISRLVTEKGYEDEGHWEESQKFALKLLRASKVRVRYMPNEK